MKNLQKLFLLSGLFLLLTATNCEKKSPVEPPDLKVITVENITLKNVTTSTATLGGTITGDFSDVTEYGVCWSTTNSPTIADNKAIATIENGSFVITISNLTTGTTYYVRAYVTDNSGTIYGDERSFIATITTKEISWQKSLGGSDFDWANSIQQTQDGGYIVAGSSASDNGDVTGNHGGSDYWIVKLTLNGEIEWQKSLGGSEADKAHSIQQTNDGGYIVAGSSMSDDGDVTENHGSWDYWVVKLTSNGEIDWQKSLGGSWIDKARSIQQTEDGGYIVAGFSESDDGDVTGYHGGKDYWIVKLTSNGEIDWQKSLGGSDFDWANSIQQTQDGGYIVAGSSMSDDGDVKESHGDVDYWIIKLTSNGEIDWQKSLGGSDSENAFSIRQTNDGGYIAAGFSYSHNGDIMGNHGSADYWVVKLTANGEIDWQKSLGGSSWDWAYSIWQTNDGGYIVAGSSTSSNGDITEHRGTEDYFEEDYWIVKLASDGEIDWQKSLGGSSTDEASSIQQTNDGGYIVAGFSYSKDGDVTENHGGGDFWIVKFTAFGEAK